MKTACLVAILVVVGVGGGIGLYDVVMSGKSEVVSTAAPGVVATQSSEVVAEKTVTAEEKSVVSEDGKTRVGFTLNLTMPK